MTPRFIRSADDLVTSVQATQNGFLKQALRKTEKAAPYVAEAQKLRKALEKTNSVHDLVGITGIQEALLTACGFSDKSTAYFNEEEQRATLVKILEVIADQAGDTWREEIVYRFLLTRGDSLGGAMRNIVGAEAGTLFAEALCNAASRKGVTGLLVKAKRDGKVQGLAWPQRTIFFDKAPKFLAEQGSKRNNIDVIMVDSGVPRPTHNIWSQQRALLSDPRRYLACGELKGGIDPAGADEHWKTAASALDRIRRRFPKNPPKLFFAGAAIAKAMATEIFDQLQSGQLAHAANLTVPQQVNDLADWLISL